MCTFITFFPPLDIKQKYVSVFSLCLWRPWSTRKRSLWNTPKVSATPSKHTSKTESECDHYSINIIFLCSAPSNWGGSRLMLKSLSCQLIWYLVCLVLSLSPEVIFFTFSVLLSLGLLPCKFQKVIVWYLISQLLRTLSSFMSRWRREDYRTGMFAVTRRVIC